MFEFRERKERKRGEEGTGLVRGPVKCEDANESGPKPGEGSLPPRTFNLRGNLAHVDLLAAVPCALQGYRALVRAPPPPLRSRAHTPPDSLRALPFIGAVNPRRAIVLSATRPFERVKNGTIESFLSLLARFILQFCRFFFFSFHPIE